MNSNSLAVKLTGAADALAVAAEDRVAGALVRSAADAFAGSDVVVADGGDGSVRLQAKGLRARAFGSRSRAADPRFAGLLATLARGDSA